MNMMDILNLICNMSGSNLTSNTPTAPMEKRDSYVLFVTVMYDATWYDASWSVFALAACSVARSSRYVLGLRANSTYTEQARRLWKRFCTRIAHVLYLEN